MNKEFAHHLVNRIEMYANEISLLNYLLLKDMISNQNYSIVHANVSIKMNEVCDVLKTYLEMAGK